MTSGNRAETIRRSAGADPTSCFVRRANRRPETARAPAGRNLHNRSGFESFDGHTTMIGLAIWHSMPLRLRRAAIATCASSSVRRSPAENRCSPRLVCPRNVQMCPGRQAFESRMVTCCPATTMWSMLADTLPIGSRRSCRTVGPDPWHSPARALAVRCSPALPIAARPSYAPDIRLTLPPGVPMTFAVACCIPPLWQKS